MSEQELIKAARANIGATNARDWKRPKATLADDVMCDESAPGGGGTRNLDPGTGNREIGG